MIGGILCSVSIHIPCEDQWPVRDKALGPPTIIMMTAATHTRTTDIDAAPKGRW